MKSQEKARAVKEFEQMLQTEMLNVASDSSMLGTLSVKELCLRVRMVLHCIIIQALLRIQDIHKDKKSMMKVPSDAGITALLDGQVVRVSVRLSACLCDI